MDVPLGVKLPKTAGDHMWPDGESAGQWGRRIEDMGYASVWTSEAWGSNAFVDLTDVAHHTDDLVLGTAIANVFSRSPAVLAMGAASLSRLSGGRAVLGVGTSHPALVEGLHGVDFERPVRRSHETIELVAALLDGNSPVDYDGDLVSTAPQVPLSEPVPVYNAALGPANRRATGRVADGWIPYLLPFSRLEPAFEAVATGARDRGRNPADIDVVPQVISVVDPDPAAARQRVREFVATFVGEYDAYERIIADAFPEETAAIAERYDAGDEAAAADRVTDEMVGEFGVAGTAAEARDQLRSILETDVVDSAIVYVPSGSPDRVLDRTLSALAPAHP